MTAMSSQYSATSPSEWVMRRMEQPMRSRRPQISFITCASTVASSAVVGSSAISRSGRASSAMAMATRWRMPPLSSCGYCVRRTSGRSMPTAARASTAAWRRASPAKSGERRVSTSLRCAQMENTGLSEANGSWKIIAMRLPAQRRRRLRLRQVEAVGAELQRAGVTRALAASRPMRASATVDLPLPDSPTRPEDPARPGARASHCARHDGCRPWWRNRC